MIVCYGLFSIAAQTLLFRETMAALDGRDVGIGLFFGAWFLWVALGAWVSSKAQRPTSQLARSPQLLLLAYIPAFCLQYGLIVFLREAAGAPSHASATLQHILGCSLLVTAPGCLLTGLLFPILCRWMALGGDLPVGRVYTLEAAGGVVGGLGVAALIHLGVSTAGIFVLLCLLLCLAVTWSTWTGPYERSHAATFGRAVAALCLVVVLGAAVLRIDVVATKTVHQRQWDRLAPGGVLEGSFSTAQAEYLHGADAGRWIVARNGRVYETVGDAVAAGRIVGMALAQNIRAEQVLVIGDGLAVCQGFLKSPNVKTVDWFAPDPQYVQSLLACLPEALHVSDPRLRYMTGDIGATLAGRPETYDIVVVNLPGAVNAALDPFLSVEFFEHIDKSLRSLGLLVLGIASDGNGAGKPAFVGACVKNTLDGVFAQTILVPTGPRTFFLSAPAPYLQVSPMTLQTRFSLLENAGDILPPEELETVYRPERATEVLESYVAADLSQQGVDSSRGRNHYLGQLLQIADDAGLSLVKPVQAFRRGGTLMAIAFVVVLAVVRLVYILSAAPRRRLGFSPPNSDALRSNTLMVIGGSGLVSITTFIVLIYTHQMRHGSLHLYLGPFCALSMLGLAVGAAAVKRMVSSLPHGSAQPVYFVLCMLMTLLGFHAVCLIGAGLWIEHASVSQPALATWLLLNGLFCGGVLGLGAKMLELCGLDAQSAGTRLEGADHLGAALGSSLAALLLMPLLGLEATLYVAAALVLANLISTGAMSVEVTRPGRRAVPHLVLTPAGYGLFALAACVIVGSHVLAYVERSQTQSQATMVIQEWVEGRRTVAKTTTVATTAAQAAYHEVREGSRLIGYVFRSEDFTATVYGYGGPMSVIAFADPNGTLIDFRITRSRETPRYVSRIRGWMDTLKGKTVFGDNPMAGVNTVSGATLSSDAILRLLRNSGRQFAVSVFGRNDVPQAAALPWTERIDWPLACWGAGALLTIGVIFHGRFWSRLALLAFTAGVGGFWLNKQFSTDHMIRLLSADALLAGSVASLCLLLGVPLLILLFGNIYCGYLCPFGALQELVSLIVPKRFKAKLPLSTITLGRSVKYAVLFVLVVAFFITGSKRFIEADPLISVFDRSSWSANLLTSFGSIAAVLVLLGALFVTRLWCRYLCPTGAFLSLFNRAGWLARLLPAKKFGRCEFGLSGRDHGDCIHCDRCRYRSRLIPERDEVVAGTPPNARSRLFLVILVCLAMLTLWPLLRKAPPAPPATASAQISTAPDVDSSPTPPMRQQRRRGVR